MQKKWHPSVHIQHKVVYINKVIHLNLYSPLWSKRKALSMIFSEKIVYMQEGYIERVQRMHDDK